MAKKNDLKIIAETLYEATKHQKGTVLGKILQDFVALLAKKNLLGQAEKIITAFVSYARRQECVLELEVTSAREIEKKLLHAIQKAFGEKVETTQKIDPSLLGGFTVKTKDKIFDASLKTQVKKLKQSLQ